MNNFTSESVCAGHPDKIADQISDAILDAALSQDSESRVAVETLVTKQHVFLAGEVSTQAEINYQKIAQDIIFDLGYVDDSWGFSYLSPVTLHIQQQSNHIAQGVDSGGAGDQGIMFGFATDETPELMPLPIVLAHALTSRIDLVRATKKIPYLRPDGKAQVRVDYKNGLPWKVHTIIIAVPHSPEIKNSELETDLVRHVIKPVLEKYSSLVQTNYQELIINGTGTWHIGGPAFDTGLTGRKVIVDTYGGYARHGGGAFSGKDPSKVDRSGAYAARYLAKNIVAAGLAKQCEIRIAYVIGQAYPVAVDIETFGTAIKSKKILRSFSDNLLHLSVSNVINQLDMRRPIYRETARYGHFGRNIFPWEQVVC